MDDSARESQQQQHAQQQQQNTSSSPSSSPSPSYHLPLFDDDRAAGNMSVRGPPQSHHHHAPPHFSSSNAAAEGYRAAPDMSQAPLLPPIQHFDAQQHAMQSQQQYAPPAGHVASMQAHQAPPYPPAQYPPPPLHQYQNGGLAAAPTSSTVANGQPQPNGQMMRFPIPPQQPLDARSMSGGRHKKEIKRRTKTGCLTCRKRRIKCDEAHPFCRNCQKSKRECLGYDPIFKQQPGPANIQPAPTGNTTPAPAPSAIHSNVPSIPSSNPYPPAYSGTGGNFLPSSAQQQQQYGEYGSSTSLDPALSSGPHVHMAQNNYPAALQPLRNDQLFSLNDVPPQYSLREAPPPVSPATQQEVETFYKYHYSVGLDRVFETTWYSTRGLSAMQRDSVLSDFVAQCAEQMRSKAGDEATTRQIQSLEARLVWVLAAMPRAVASSANGAGSDPQVLELLPRIDTVEALLTGQFLEPQKIPAPPEQPPPPQPHQETSPANQKYNELLFWHNLGRYTAARDDRPGALDEINVSLQHMRKILNMLENRDVFYSIAMARHVGGRMEGFHPQRHLIASTNDPNNDVNKLKVAHQFVETEEQRGTTQPIQRICAMAIRGWILQKQ